MCEHERGKIFDWEYDLYPDVSITAHYQDGNDGAYLYLYLPHTTYGGENGMVYIKPLGGNLLRMSLQRAAQLHHVLLECLNKLNATCKTRPELKLPEDN